MQHGKTVPPLPTPSHQSAQARRRPSPAGGWVLAPAEQPTEQRGLIDVQADHHVRGAAERKQRLLQGSDRSVKDSERQ